MLLFTEQKQHFGPSETGYSHWCNSWTNWNQYCGIFKGLIRTWKHLVGSPSRTEAGGIMDGKIEDLKKEKRTLETSLTKLLNKLAAELSTETPKNERRPKW